MERKLFQMYNHLKGLFIDTDRYISNIETDANEGVFIISALPCLWI